MKKIILVAALFVAQQTYAGAALSLVYGALSAGGLMLTIACVEGKCNPSHRKIILDAQDDAANFIMTEGKVRGAFLIEALGLLRSENPQSQVSDLDLAQAILNTK